MAEFDFTQAIGEARAKYESIAKALDVDRLKADIKISKRRPRPRACGMTRKTPRRSPAGCPPRNRS